MADRETLAGVSTRDLVAEARRRIVAAGGQLVVGGYLYALDGDRILRSKEPASGGPGAAPAMDDWAG